MLLSSHIVCSYLLQNVVDTNYFTIKVCTCSANFMREMIQIHLQGYSSDRGTLGDTLGVLQRCSTSEEGRTRACRAGGSVVSQATWVPTQR